MSCRHGPRRSHGLGWLPSVSLAAWLRGCPLAHLLACLTSSSTCLPVCTLACRGSRSPHATQATDRPTTKRPSAQPVQLQINQSDNPAARQAANKSRLKHRSQSNPGASTSSSDQRARWREEASQVRDKQASEPIGERGPCEANHEQQTPKRQRGRTNAVIAQTHYNAIRNSLLTKAQSEHDTNEHVARDAAIAT